MTRRYLNLCPKVMQRAGRRPPEYSPLGPRQLSTDRVGNADRSRCHSRSTGSLATDRRLVGAGVGIVACLHDGRIATSGDGTAAAPAGYRQHAGGSGRRFAGQDETGLFAHDNAAGGGRESTKQRDLFLLAAQPVPRNPDAVGVTQHRLAVVFAKLLLGNYKLPVRRDAAGGSIGFVEGINLKHSFDLNRLGVAICVEHQSTAEASYRGTATVV